MVTCHVIHLKVRSFKFPKRDKMDELKQQWIKNCGFTPEGNVEGREWATTSKDVQVNDHVTYLTLPDLL